MGLSRNLAPKLEKTALKSIRFGGMRRPAETGVVAVVLKDAGYKLGSPVSRRRLLTAVLDDKVWEVAFRFN